VRQVKPAQRISGVSARSTQSAVKLFASFASSARNPTAGWSRAKPAKTDKGIPQMTQIHADGSREKRFNFSFLVVLLSFNLRGESNMKSGSFAEEVNRG
jgi:hypothetical protein